MRDVRRRSADWETVALWAPVVGVAAVTQLRVGLEHPWTGSGSVLTLSGLLLALPLLVRRRWPITTAALVAGALPVQTLLGGTLGFGSFVAVLVAAYSSGRYARARLAVAGVAIILLGVVVAMRDSLPDEAPELVFPLFYVSVAASLGAVVRRLSELNTALAHERDASARLAVAAERMRLSRELHDSIAHTLTVAVVQAETCEQAVGDDPAAARASAIAIQEAGRRGLAELRSMLRVLRDPETSSEEPGLDDLPTLARVVSESGLQVEVATTGDLASVPPDAGCVLFRTIQEALTNVLKHSAAGTATVHVAVEPRSVTATVTDPGPALARGLPSGGHGVTVMTERVAPLGGSVTAGPDGAGYRVQARLPLQTGVRR